MSADTTKPSSPANNPKSNEAAAVEFIQQELPKARQTLRRTRIFGFFLIAFVAAYMSFICHTMKEFLQPKAAAEVASVMIAEHVTRDGPALAMQIEREIPLLIRQLPKYVTGALPDYRKQIENDIEAEFQNY